MERERLKRVVEQHAETSRLLGVDFVPSFRSEGGVDVTAVISAAETSGSQAAGQARKVQADTGKAPVASVDAIEKPHAKREERASAAKGDRSAASVRAELDEILRRYESDAPHKAFKTAHHRIVFDDGDCLARLMFIGEAPGEEEDIQGKPFVGRAGQLLNKMIAGMGLKREAVYIANVLKTRPPGNATPTLDECRLCQQYLFDQVEAVRPEVIVTLGLTATRVILKCEATMSSMRGSWHDFGLTDGTNIPVMPTFHPAYLLRAYTPENREKVWSDLKQVLEKIGLEVPIRPAAQGG